MIRKQFQACGKLILIFLIGQFGCQVFAQNGEVKLGDIFVLKTGETAQTKAGKLKIRLIGVGRTIAESGEIEYVELQINLEKLQRKIVISERGKRTKIVGKYIVELVNAESFGITNCQLKISRKN